MSEESPMSDSLTRFLEWFLANGMAIGHIPYGGRPVWTVQEVVSVLWLRQPPFQVQLFLVPPGVLIPEHTHPNVDSYEVYCGGQIKFSHRGKWVVPDAAFTARGDGLAASWGRAIRVRPSDRHGGAFGPAGGVFMSVQEWINGVAPHDVAADYSGVVMGPAHYAQVTAGTPVVQEALTLQDVAPLEPVQAIQWAGEHDKGD